MRMSAVFGEEKIKKILKINYLLEKALMIETCFFKHYQKSKS